MEGRERQDADAVRRSGGFAGRQVPLEMGKVRVGGSGRPVPDLFSAGASRRAVTSSQEAVAAALSPRETLEPHPRSPFRRKEGLSKTVVRVLQESTSSRFQAKKSTGPHPLSARSPQLQSSFTARELTLFTQRLDTTEPAGKVQTRYHVASHPHSAAATFSAASPETRQEASSSLTTHKRSFSSSTRRYEATNVLKKEDVQAESSWRRVDTSIDHIYEDPSIDVVQLHLLHSHHTTTGQKKRKMVERERVLAAASGLRENQSEEQRRQEQVQQRKMQIQKMSEAIRLQNQRAVQARPGRSTELNDRRVRSGRRSESAPTLPKRKPPVPRLSGNGKQQQSKRKSRPMKENAASLGGVSASILMGSTSNVGTRPEELDSEMGAKDPPITKSGHVDHQSVKRKNSVTAPRQSKKKKQEVSTLPIDVGAAVQAREERRAIAREYMQLQKHSRRIWSAKAKEQSQLEREKRQQQLELLEATRLKNLRLSKKKAKRREKQEDFDPLFPGNSSPATVATSIICSSPTLEDLDTDVFTKPAEIREDSKDDNELVLDELHIDSENDQAIGNLKLTGQLVYHGTGILNAHEQHNGSPIPEAKQSTEADDRVRKLLQLREKAAALSARLSGLRNRTGKTEVVVRVDDAFAYDSVADLSGSGTTASAGDDCRALTRDPGTVALPNIEVLKFSSRSDEAVPNSQRRSNDHSTSGTTTSSKIHGDTECKQSQRLPCQVNPPQEYMRELNIAPDNDGVCDDNEAEVVDVRSIGVYNIGVVWPPEQQSKAVKTISESKQVIKSVSASSSSSLSSSAASPSSSVILRRANSSAQVNESSEDDKQSIEGAPEVEFYKQLKNRLYSSEAATVVDCLTTNAAQIHYREEIENASDSDSNSDQDRHFLEPTPQTKSFPTNRDVSDEHLQHYGGYHQSNAGLMRLIRETDDSLSVINRAAKKLFDEQRDQMERKKDKVLQKRIEAEKHELLRKDMALKAVLASLNGANSNSVEDEVEGSESEIDYDDKNEMHSSQYKRLEEIMDEVENERNLNTQRVQIDKSELIAQRDERLREGEEQLPDYITQRVQIDKSELTAQREARLREDEEQLPDRIDSPPRTHSPRTLSKRLMAAVDYQEALHEAHMQLSTMEHAHELETVQTETLKLAHAFKEEMDHNASTHQLALDHATLEKKFDGDMHDVLQQLDVIRQAEEHEQIVNKTLVAQELRLANLRECSVQTEVSQHADAATSAALCVDTSTSPIRFCVDAAVQHDTTDQKLEESFSAVDINNESNNDSEDSYEESFENESQMRVKLQPRDTENPSEASSYAKSAAHFALEIEEENESEIQKLSSDATEDDRFDESGMATSTSIVEQSFADVDDEGNTNEAREDNGDSLASVDYEEDFEASSTNMKEARNQVHYQTTVGEAIEGDLEVSGSVDNRENGEDIEEQFDQENGITDMEIAESDQIADHANSSSEPSDSEYDEDFASVSESTLQSAPVAPSIMSKLFGKKNILDKPSEDENSEEFEAESFEEVQHESRADSNGKDEIISEATSYETDKVKQQHLEQEVEDTVAVEDSNYDVASEIPSDQSDIGDDVAPSVGDEKEESIVSNQNVDGVKAGSDDYEDDYEDQYENESFDEAQSASDILFDEGGKIDKNDGTFIKAGYDVEGVYSGVVFERVPDQEEPNLAVECFTDESKARMTSVSLLSHDMEEGSLTKSIEERIASLQALRQKIADRKSEALAVRQQMRVERRKQDLVAEERDLLDEKEAIERLLAADKAALALCRQRNGVEMMHLEARQGKHSIAGRSVNRSYDPKAEANHTLVCPPGSRFDVGDDVTPIIGDEKEENIVNNQSVGGVEAGSEDYEDDYESQYEKESFDKEQHESRAERNENDADVSEATSYETDKVKQQHHDQEVENAVAVDDSKYEVASEIPSDQSDIGDEDAVPSVGDEKEESIISIQSVDGVESGNKDYEDDYESQQHESESRADSNGKDEIISEATSYETDKVKQQHHEQEVEDTVAVEDSNYDVASEIPSDQSDIGDDAAPSVGDEKEESIVSNQNVDGVKAGSDDYEDDYEDQYENESFDEAQSASDILFNEGGNIDKDDGTFINDDEGVYSDEMFDSVSGSFTNEESPVFMPAISPRLPQGTVISPIEITDTPMTTNKTGAKEDELDDAVVGQFVNKNADPLIPHQEEPNFALESFIDESKALMTSVSVSLSHDVEAESLTKSIEERIARLQALRLKIADRKSGILAVQNQMRVERRKEELVAEERDLLGEKESVERLLAAEEAALALCRQRNRIESMHLEARQVEHPIAGRSTKQVHDSERDLLLGFDYVENVQVDGLQNRSPTGASLSTASSCRIGIGLLDGYAYIEAVEPINSYVDVPIVAVPPSIAVIKRTNAEQRGRGESGVDENSMWTQTEETLCVLNGEKKQEQQGIDEGDLVPARYSPKKEQHGPTGSTSTRSDDENSQDDDKTLSLITQNGDAQTNNTASYPPIYQEMIQQESTDRQEHELENYNVNCSSSSLGQGTDLLAEYAHVEIAESVLEMQAELSAIKLLVDFDFVETAEAVEMQTVDDETRDEEPDEMAKLPDNNYDDHYEKLENTFTAGYLSRSEEDMNESTSVISNSTIAQWESPIHLENTTIEDEEAREKSSIIEKSREDEGHAVETDALNSTEAGIGVDRDGSPLHEAHQSVDSPNEAVAERVASLLYADFSQALEEDIVTSIIDRRDVQSQPGIQELHEPEDLKLPRTEVMQSERVSDAIYDTVLDDILRSELHLWSRQESTNSTTSSPEYAVKSIGSAPPVKTPSHAPIQRQKLSLGPRERDRGLADHITGKLEIVDGKIWLPRFGTLEVEEASPTARVLYDTIEDLARDCFGAIQQSSSILDEVSILAVIHRHIQTEVDELLAIREQSERELERQLQLLSEDSETEGGLTGDILLSQNCVASNVSSIVSKVQSDLSRTTEVLSTAPKSGLLPRTPISRAKSTSILSSLQTQQDEELQQRITENVSGAPRAMGSPAVVTALLDWLESHGVADSLLDIRYLGKLEGHGVFAKQSLKSGQVTLQVPFKLTMNIESAAQSDLAPVLQKYPQIPADEVLALHLMHERSKGEDSFFAPFIASLPTTFDLPVFWSETELNEIKGTNVLLLTQLMKQHLERDFENIHQAVTEDFPQVFASLPMLTLGDYMWAMGVMWSRAFGVSKGETYLRVLCPAMDMFNHDVGLLNPLDDFISFDEEKQMMTHHVPKDVVAGSALQISYGQYSNAKLLYSYGFVGRENSRRAVDFWMKIPTTDPYLKLKQTVLDANELTSQQTYDFCGTIFKDNVDERLLATLRVILMNEQEIRQYKKAFESSILSIRNELAVYENLQNTCRRKLASYPTTLEEDEAILAESGTKSNPRLSLAVRVRFEDKQVFTGVIATLDQWKVALTANPETYPPSTTRS